MNTYGDMVTLLLAFFVMLFAFSNLDIERFRAIMSAFQGAIGVLDSGATITQGDAVSGGDTDSAELIQRSILEIPETQDVVRRLNEVRQLPEMRSAYTVEVTQRGIIVHFTDRVLFDLGDANLKPEAEGVLTNILDVLRSWPNHIRVEGHTDNLPIATPIYPSNWELSTARAARVVRFFIEEGNLPPDRMSAAGYGEYRPIATNDTLADRARNRRVDIVLLSDAVTAREPSARLAP